MPVACAEYKTMVLCC